MSYQGLLDMGFTESDASIAIKKTGSFEEAVEFLIM
jgi:hypothetical protein